MLKIHLNIISVIHKIKQHGLCSMLDQVNYLENRNPSWHHCKVTEYHLVLDMSWNPMQENHQLF